jgi:uncharacterized protein YjiS (DUF1127 family)
MDTGLRQQGLLTIAPGAVLRLRDAAGRHLSVVQGSVWVTQHGDLRDAVLDGGDSFRFTRQGLSLVQALDGRPAVVALEDGLAPETVAGAAPAEGAWRLARSQPVQRAAHQLRAEALGQLSDHLLRDLGLRRDRIGFGGGSRECAHC